METTATPSAPTTPARRAVTIATLIGAISDAAYMVAKQNDAHQARAIMDVIDDYEREGWTFTPGARGLADAMRTSADLTIRAH